MLYQRFCYLGILLAATSLASAQQQDFSKVEIRTTRLAEGLYVLQGEGGTTAAVAAALKAGKTLDQMKQQHILGAWSERYSPPKAFVDTDAFIETLYNSLRGHTARHGGPTRPTR